MIDQYFEVYKASRNDSYKFWAEALTEQTISNEKIIMDMLLKKNQMYIDMLEGNSLKDAFRSLFRFKDDVELAFDEFSFETVRPEVEAGLFEVHVASSISGIKEFKNKVGVQTTFTGSESYSINYYKDLTEKSADYLLDTDKRALANILKRKQTEGLTVRQTKKLMIDRLSDTPKIASRAHNIAITETTKSLNWAKFQSGLNATIPMKKTWFTTGDQQVRLSHAILDGVTLNLNEMFLTGLGSEAMYPGDADLPAADIVGCRCTFSEYPA